MLVVIPIPDTSLVELTDVHMKKKMKTTVCVTYYVSEGKLGESVSSLLKKLYVNCTPICNVLGTTRLQYVKIKKSCYFCQFPLELLIYVLTNLYALTCCTRLRQYHSELKFLF